VKKSAQPNLEKKSVNPFAKLIIWLVNALKVYLGSKSKIIHKIIPNYSSLRIKL
jgi:hypothetical protein